MNIHAIYRPFLKYFRTKRMGEFWNRFHLTPDTEVLDVGGSPFNWSLLPTRPRVTFLNIYPEQGSARWIVADGRRLPFKDLSFDVVYSNSVIEHLGNLENQRLFAAECRRVGRNYYVQTPNRWFLVEPHLITPFIHWMPRGAQKLLLRNFTIWGLVTRPSVEECDGFMRETRLLDEVDLRCLFPNAEIWHELFLGLTKSLIAAKANNPRP